MKAVVVTAKHLRGVIARWAVQQSPYETGPDDLGIVLAEITRRFNAHPGTKMCMGSRYLELAPSYPELYAFVEPLLDGIPQVQKWNERKNGRDGHGFVTAFDGDKGNPDDDFIDICAIVQNVARDLLTDDIECECRSKRMGLSAVAVEMPS